MRRKRAFLIVKHNPRGCAQTLVDSVRKYFRSTMYHRLLFFFFSFDASAEKRRIEEKTEKENLQNENKTKNDRPPSYISCLRDKINHRSSSSDREYRCFKRFLVLPKGQTKDVRFLIIKYLRRRSIFSIEQNST